MLLKWFLLTGLHCVAHGNLFPRDRGLESLACALKLSHSDIASLILQLSISDMHIGHAYRICRLENSVHGVHGVHGVYGVLGAPGIYGVRGGHRVHGVHGPH